MTQKIQKEIKRNILLNPGPATTTATVKAGLVVPDICPREAEFGDLLGAVKQKALKVVNAGAHYEAILLGGSGTAAVEACLSSCTNESGILILENGAYGDRIKKICDALKIKSHLIKSAWGDALNLSEIEAHLKTNAKDYNVIAFIHHETTVGILNDLSAINNLAKKYQLKTLVDAMSSYAGIEIDLAKDDVDYLISSSNKCIQGMAGLGICIVKKEILNEIKNYPKRSFYLDLHNNFLAQEKTNQFAFTPPVQILYSLDIAFNEFFIEGGIKARAKRYSDLYELMLKGMTELGFETLVEKKLHSKILTAFKEPTIKNFSFEKMHDFLYAQGITIYPGKSAKENSFRISNIGELNTADILTFLKGVEAYLKSLN